MTGTLIKQREVWLALGIVAMIAAISTRFASFAQPQNLLQVFNDTSILIILALGLSLIFSLGGIVTREVDVDAAAVGLEGAEQASYPLHVALGIGRLLGQP